MCSASVDTLLMRVARESMLQIAELTTHTHTHNGVNINMLAGRLLNIYLFIWTVTPQASCPAIRLSSSTLVRLSQTTQSPLDLSTFTYHTHTHAVFLAVYSQCSPSLAN